MTSSPPEPLLTVRATVILLLAPVVAVLAGGLSYLTDHSVPAAALTGGAVAGEALLLFHTVIRPSHPTSRCEHQHHNPPATTPEHRRPGPTTRPSNRRRRR